MYNSQLQLGFCVSEVGPPRAAERRLSRATWWFARMRQAADRPFEAPFLAHPPRNRFWRHRKSVGVNLVN